MSKTHVPLDQVRDNPYQVRIGTGDLDNLAQSVLAHGLRQLPEARLLVEGEHWTGSYRSRTKQVDSKWRLTDGVAELASGHRRAAAVQLLNDDDTVSKAQLTSVGLVPGYLPVDLQRLSDEEMLDVGTAENLDRQDLSPIEEARLIQEHVNAGRSLDAIAPHFGDRSASWVSNRKRLLKLPVSVQKHVHEGEISVRQAQALARGYGADIDVTPDGLVEKALNGADSDWLREEVDAFVERVEENGESFSPDVGTTHPKARAPARSDSTTNEDVKDDDPDRDRTEASASDGGSDAGARASEDLRSNDRNGTERASSEDSASRPSVDEEECEESKGTASRVVLVACSKTKLNTPAHAQALYKGQLFEKSKAYAKQLVEDGEADAWYILSAKHGLVEPNEILEPYDKTLSNVGSEEKMEWARGVLMDLSNAIGEVTAEVLGGQDYWQPLVRANRGRPDSIEVVTPFRNMIGNGEMMQWLDVEIEMLEKGANTAHGLPDHGTMDHDSDEITPEDDTPAEQFVRESNQPRKADEMQADRKTKLQADEAETADEGGAPGPAIPTTVATEETSGDGAPTSDSDTGRPARLTTVIEAVEADGHDWKLQSLDEGHYQGTVQNGGTAHIAEGTTPAGALQSAWHSAQEVSNEEIGQVNPADVDLLLSADGEEMWEPVAAEEASIASLLVAHRVAGQRQETWRTTLIAEAVEKRAGRVQRDDVPDEVLDEVEAEVERRLEAVEV